MPNKLFIRPHSLEINEDSLYEWAIYDVAGKQVSYAGGSDLDSILQVLMQNGIDAIELSIFWPAHAAYTTAVELPGNQARYLAQALPFAVEEQLAQDLDNVHLVAGEKHKEFGYPVICVDKHAFAELFDAFRDSEVLVLKAVSVDADVIPLGEHDLAMVISSQQVLLKSKRNAAIGLSKENLIPYLDAIFLGTAEEATEEGEAFSIKVYIEQDEMEVAKLQLAEIEQYPSVSLHVEEIAITPFELLCECCVRQIKPATNLCQGDFRLLDNSASEWKKWRGIAAILLLGFIVQLGVFWGKGIHYQQQADAVAEQAVKEYRSVAGGSKTLSPDKLARIIKGKLNQSGQGAASESGFLDLLGEAGYQFSQSANKQNFRFSSINYNRQRGELVLELHAGSFEQLDALKKAIVDAGLTAKISSAVQEKDYFRGRISVSGS